ncbi:MAG: hypothetical protein IJ365_01990 [Clostridia bacterium]|nr:hypothetical protein [Clostridia bacterium]
MNKFLKVFSVYNLINVVIAYAYEFIKILAQTNSFAYLIASILGIFINVFSYVSLISLVVSIIAVIYYFIRSLRTEQKSESYVYMFINMINVMSIAYFVALTLAQM